MEAKLGTTICQPIDSAPAGILCKIARLTFNNRMRKNLFDSAVVDCWSDEQQQHLCLPEIYGVGAFNSEARDPLLGDSIFKVGRTTGYQEGIVTKVSVATAVEHDPGQIAYFENQYEAKRRDGGAFSAGGDSGSAIMLMDRTPCGQLHAGGGNATIFSGVLSVMKGMKIDFEF
jgi:hypothetical protein